MDPDEVLQEICCYLCDYGDLKWTWFLSFQQLGRRVLPLLTYNRMIKLPLWSVDTLWRELLILILKGLRSLALLALSSRMLCPVIHPRPSQPTCRHFSAAQFLHKCFCLLCERPLAAIWKATPPSSFCSPRAARCRRLARCSHISNPEVGEEDVDPTLHRSDFEWLGKPELSSALTAASVARVGLPGLALPAKFSSFGLCCLESAWYCNPWLSPQNPKAWPDVWDPFLHTVCGCFPQWQWQQFFSSWNWWLQGLCWGWPFHAWEKGMML